jgi:hypothetical protein
MKERKLILATGISAVMIVAGALVAYLYGALNFVILGLVGFGWSLLAGVTTYFVQLETEQKMKDFYSSRP